MASRVLPAYQKEEFLYKDLRESAQTAGQDLRDKVLELTGKDISPELAVMDEGLVYLANLDEEFETQDKDHPFFQGKARYINAKAELERILENNVAKTHVWNLFSRPFIPKGTDFESDPRTRNVYKELMHAKSNYDQSTEKIRRAKKKLKTPFDKTRGLLGRPRVQELRPELQRLRLSLLGGHSNTIWKYEHRCLRLRDLDKLSVKFKIPIDVVITDKRYHL